MQWLLGALAKQSRLSAYYSVCWGTLWKQNSLLTHCSCSWGPLWRQSSELWFGSEIPWSAPDLGGAMAPHHIHVFGHKCDMCVPLSQF